MFRLADMGLKDMIDHFDPKPHDNCMEKKKRPTDVNQLAKMLVEMVTGPHEKPVERKSSPAVKKPVKNSSKSAATKALPKKNSNKPS